MSDQLAALGRHEASQSTVAFLLYTDEARSESVTALLEDEVERGILAEKDLHHRVAPVMAGQFFANDQGGLGVAPYLEE